MVALNEYPGAGLANRCCDGWRLGPSLVTMSTDMQPPLGRILRAGQTRFSVWDKVRAAVRAEGYELGRVNGRRIHNAL
jgi:hypothetical protein